METFSVVLISDEFYLHNRYQNQNLISIQTINKRLRRQDTGRIFGPELSSVFH